MYEDRLMKPRAAQGRTHIEEVVEKQKASMNLKPAHLWANKYGRQFPLLREIAIRLLTMATQSADVERCCKVHKLVHRKDRTRQKT